MSFIWEFPHASGLDSDLHEILITFKKLVDEYNNLENLYNDTVALVNKLENDVDNLYTYVDDEIAKGLQATKDEITGQLNSTLDEVKTLLNEQEARIDASLKTIQDNLDALDKDVTERLLENAQEMEALENKVATELNSTIAIVDSKIIAIRADLTKEILDGDKNLQLQILGIEQEIKDLQAGLLPIINPVTRESEPVQKVVNDLWDSIVREGALTCAEFPARGYTIGELGALRLTCIQWATQTKYWMPVRGAFFNPLSGERMDSMPQACIVPMPFITPDSFTCGEIAKLASGVTCQEYADRGISCYALAYNNKNFYRRV